MENMIEVKPENYEEKVNQWFDNLIKLGDEDFDTKDKVKVWTFNEDHLFGYKSSETINRFIAIKKGEKFDINALEKLRNHILKKFDEYNWMV